MEIKQLEYFLAVSEQGSFSRAAVMLSVAQPILSRYVRSLEEELGTELFYRNGRGVIVTESGEALTVHARNILNSVHQISSDVAAVRDSPGGRLVIGLPPTANVILGAPLVKRFREAYPRVKLKIQEGFSGHVYEWLSTGRIDVAILYNAPKTSTLITQPLIEEELCLIGAADAPAELRERPVTGAELGKLPMILPSHPHGLRRLVDCFLAEINVEPNVEYEIDSLTSCLELVEQGCGYTILPYASVRRQVQAGQVVVMALVEPRMTRQLVLATSTQRPMTTITRALASEVSDLVKELVHNGSWQQEKSLQAKAAREAAASEAYGKLRIAASRDG